MPAEEAPNDPLNLGRVDQQIRINELEQQLQDLGMSEVKFDGDCPPDVQEQFLRSVMEFESASKSSWFALLEAAGVALPPPTTIDDASLPAKLTQIFDGLAAMCTYVHCTDHLSDRQLYEHLWSGSLRESGMAAKPGSGWINGIDLIGSGSDEDIRIWQQYYMTDEQRARWASDFPGDVMPPKEKRPYDRDRFLPKPPPMVAEDDDTFEDCGDDDQAAGEE